MIHFVSTDYYGANAAEAPELTSLTLPRTGVNSTTAGSFRIANNSPDCVYLSLEAPESDPLEISFSANSIALLPGAVSNTITVYAEVPITGNGGNRIFEVLAIPEDDPYAIPAAVLPVSLEIVGPNVTYAEKYPERAGPITDQLGTVILSASEVLDAHIYDPIGLESVSNGVAEVLEVPSLSFGARFRLANDPCARLNKDDWEWGYAASDTRIEGAFQHESDAFTLEFKIGSTIEFSKTAKLYLPGHYENLLHFALFEDHTENEPEQYKRTVILLERDGILWWLATAVPQYKGPYLAYFECQLAAVSDASNSSLIWVNPFAITWDLRSRKPIRLYTCPTTFEIGNEYVTPDAPLCPACPDCPDCPPVIPTGSAPIPVSAVGNASAGTLALTFDQPLQEADLYLGNWTISFSGKNWSADSATITDNRIDFAVLEAGGMAFTNIISYAPAPTSLDLIGANGLLAYPFSFTWT